MMRLTGGLIEGSIDAVGCVAEESDIDGGGGGGGCPLVDLGRFQFPRPLSPAGALRGRFF